MQGETFTRCAPFLTAGNQDFKANPSLAQKIKKENTFRDFYGDTIVFALDDTSKEKLAEYADFLYRTVPECFCEKLVSNTFHVTLHDLGNSPILRNVAEELFENELKLIGKMDEIQAWFWGCTLQTKKNTKK